MVTVAPTASPVASNAGWACAHSSASTIEPRFGQLDEVRDHVGGEVRVERDGDHARLRDADLGEVGLHRVLAEQQHAVARGEAGGGERVGDLVRRLVGPPVGDAREGLVAVGALPAGDGDLVGIAPGQPFEDVADRRALETVYRPAPAESGDVDVHGCSMT